MKLLNIFVVAVLVTVAGAASAKSVSKWNSESQIRKADYIYLEALRQNMLSADDASYELIRRSYLLNPSDEYVGWEKGVNQIRLSAGDSIDIVEGFDLMSNYVDKNPGDLYSSLILAGISQRLGRRDKERTIWESLHQHFPQLPEVTMRYAEILSTVPGEKDRVLALYDSIEVIEGKSIPLTNQKLKLYFMDRDTTQLLNEVKSLVMSSPDKVDYNVFAGDIYGQFSSRDSALIYYDKAVELDPSSGLAYYSRANFFRNLNDSLAYDREVFQALKQPDLDIAPKLEILQGYIADLYTDPTQRQRINDLFKVLTDLHPHEADIYKLYTGYLIAVEDYKGAAEQSDNALSLDPSDEKGWLRLGSLYLRAGEKEKALEAAQRAQHYFPENPTLPLFEGISYARLERYDNSIEALKRSMALTDANDNFQMAEILTSIGDTYYAAGKSDSAYVYYNDALTRDPQNPTVLNNFAYYMANTGQELDKALEMITRCLEIRPDDTNSLDTFAWVLFKLKRYEEAKDVIDQLLYDENEDNPEDDEEEYTDENSEELLSHAGDIYFMNGDHKKAVEFWKKALELNPDDELLQRKVKHKTFFYE